MIRNDVLKELGRSSIAQVETRVYIFCKYDKK
jgi:hypothetical protein